MIHAYFLTISVLQNGLTINPIKNILSNFLHFGHNPSSFCPWPWQWPPPQRKVRRPELAQWVPKRTMEAAEANRLAATIGTGEMAKSPSKLAQTMEMAVMQVNKFRIYSYYSIIKNHL